MKVETRVVVFESINCNNCGLRFLVPKEWRKTKVESHGTFYCPDGHGNYYPQLNEEEKLRNQIRKKDQVAARLTQRLDQERADAKYQKNCARGQKAAKTRMRNRIQNGVCPCCNRHFENLQRHMESKHPKHKD